MSLQASREVVEWDWTTTTSYNRLHAPAEWDDPDYAAMDENGLTVCGYRGTLLIPGIFSRLARPRCAHCCDALGWPRGKGSPKNDVTLRPLVEARIAELEAAP